MTVFCECGCGEPAPIATKTDTAQGYIKGKPMRFVRGHHMRLRLKSQVEYLIQDCGYKTPCWVWQRGLGGSGYGAVHDSAKGYAVGAHVIYYERRFGKTPLGLELDHLCRNRRCVNPEHLEPVTPIENRRRGSTDAAAERTHCPNGHEYTPNNVYIWKGKRSCKACRNDAVSRYRDRKERDAMDLNDFVAEMRPERMAA